MARKSKINEELDASKKKRFEQIAGNLEILPAHNFLKDNFLPYSWSFVLDRALTNVTGLKPVQRRILYTMYKNGLTPSSNKSVIATIGGDVIHFHPHGDASINEALKNLGREHIFRVPLIDTSDGDFGSPGSPGAAARYLKTRLNKAGWINVEEIGEHAVKMVPNYDNKDVEPVDIPVKWPIAVINGGSGIATGYASNMPSHNPTEIMKACKLLLRNPDATHAALQKIILGPDFNMGGQITSNDGIKSYLENGSGSFKIRGNYEVTTGARNVSKIEFYEIPYGSYPEKVIQEIQKAIEKGHFKEIASFKDLSDLKHPIRVVVETKPSANAKKVVQDLFKHTSLESNFAANITTVVDNRPKQSSMKELLLDFIRFRKQCVANKTNYSLPKKMDRLHLIEGLMKTLLDIDKAIAIIRKSNTTADANAALQKAFKIDEAQAEYVLSLQLRRLTKMDKQELDDEKKAIELDVEYMKKLLTDEDVLNEYLMKEFDSTLKVIGDDRKTDINNMSAEEFVEAEKSLVKELKNVDKNVPCYVTRFANGTIIKSAEPFKYIMTARKLDNSPIVEQFKMNSQDFIVLIDSTGTGHKVPLSYLTEDKKSSAKDAGVSLPKGVNIVGIAKFESMKSDVGVAVGVKSGGVKVAKTDFPKNAESFPVVTLDAGDEVVDCRWIGKTLTGTYFVMVSKAGNIIAFDAAGIRASGSKAGTVRGMKMKNASDEVIHFGWVSSLKDDSMVVTVSNKTIKSTLISEIPAKGRGGLGVATQIFKNGETHLVRAYVGPNVAICANRATHNTIAAPPVAKRSGRGTDFEIDVLIGSSEVTPL